MPDLMSFFRHNAVPQGHIGGIAGPEIELCKMNKRHKSPLPPVYKMTIEDRPIFHLPKTGIEADLHGHHHRCSIALVQSS